MQGIRSWAWAGVVAVLAASCTDPLDKAAKKRIFSPEDAPKVIASAAEKLPLEEVAAGGRVARRVLGMGAAEATERLGPHKYTATVKFEWSGPGSVDLLETRTLEAGPGGVNGDFHATVVNARDQGLEVLRVGGEVYARSRYGKFRQRLRDRGMAEREREEVYGALRDFDALLLQQEKLEPHGTVTYEGRSAWKYSVSLASAPATASAAFELPPRALPKGGEDPSTQRRLQFFNTRQPTALEGEVLVDAKTSVVLKAKLEAKLAVPSSGKEKPAALKLFLDSALSDIGTNFRLQAPREFLPDADKPEGIAATLDRFGVPRGGIDGGVPSKDSEKPELEDESQ